MRSKTKYLMDEKTIKDLFHKAGIDNIKQTSPLGAGEYNAVYLIVTDNKEYVLKIAPMDNVPVLTYEKDMMASEVYWYNQMSEHTSISVPVVYYHDFSKEMIPAQFFIMEKIDGAQLDKMDFSDEEKARSVTQTAKMAAGIHEISNNKFGYIQNELYDDWYSAIRAMIEALIKDCTEKNQKTSRGEKLLSYIDRYKSVLEKAECTMVNFDIWDPNILCKRENGTIKYTWIDPERSFWGDRIMDFVCLEMATPLAKKVQSLHAYNEVSSKPIQITKEEEIRYAVAQGYLGLIMETEKYYRYSPLHFGWWRNVFASAWLFKSAFGVLKNEK